MDTFDINIKKKGGNKMKKTFVRPSMKVIFIGIQDVLAKSVGWNGDDWDNVLDGYSNMYGGGLK